MCKKEQGHQFHLQCPLHCQQEKKGKQGTQDTAGKAGEGLCLGLATTWHQHQRTGFASTDLLLCLFHKTPFLVWDAGTRESGFDKVC